MARKLRLEIEGGLYHVITRGNDRQDVFHSHEDHLKFLSLLSKQKERSPFYLYAYCLMTNHVHLLIDGKMGSDLRFAIFGSNGFKKKRAQPRSTLFLF